MRRHLDDVRTAFGVVFARAAYLVAAGALALAALLLAIWLPNVGLLIEVFGSAGIPFATKLHFALSLLGGIATNFSALSATYTVTIAVLFGVNAAMIIYSLKKKRTGTAQPLAVGAGGLASGVLGIGCAACGSLIAGTVFSFVGASGALAVLPLGGGEFGLLSVALLAVSLSFVSRDIAESTRCSVPRKPRSRSKRIDHHSSFNLRRNSKCISLKLSWRRYCSASPCPPSPPAPPRRFT